MKTFEIEYIIQHPEEFSLKVEHIVMGSMSRYTARNLETGEVGGFWVPIEDTIYRPRLEALVDGDGKAQFTTITMAEVLHRPDDFSLSVSINELSREIGMKLVDKRFNERSTLQLEEEDPTAAFIAVLWKRAEKMLQESDSGQSAAYQSRIASLSSLVSVKSSRIATLEQRIAELEKQIADEAKENDEYAYVEGWDEF